MPSITTSGPHEGLLDTLTTIAIAVEKSRLTEDDSDTRLAQVVAHLSLLTGIERIEPESE